MKQTTLDTSLLPNVWLKWETKKGINWLECNTGKKQMEKPDVSFDWRNKNNIFITAGSKPRWSYIKYHPDIEMLELAIITIPTNRKEEVHEWQYAGDKYFMNKNKIVYNEAGQPHTGNFQIFSKLNGYYYPPYSESNLLNTLTRFSIHPNWIKEFTEFIGSEYYMISNGRTITVTHPWHMQDWYDKKQITGPYTKGREGKLVDKLTAIPLSDCTDIAAAYPVKENHGAYRNWRSSTIPNIVYFERVNDDWSVLRMMKRYQGTLKETERLYLSDNGKNRICCYDKNTGWIPSRRFRDYWDSYYFANKEEAMEKCKRIKYLMPLIKDDDIDIKTLLMTLVTTPELEQLAKFGHVEIARSIALNTYPNAALKKRFGGFYNEKETNLLRKVGMTKHQLDRYLAITKDNWYARQTLNEMRKFFGDNLTPIDNVTFEKYLRAFNQMFNANSAILSGLDNLDIDYHKFVRNIVRLGEKRENSYSMMADTIRMYQALNFGTQPRVNWYCEDYSDLARLHDAIMHLKLQQDAERRAMWNRSAAEQMKRDEERRIKVDKERQHLEYEDDKYIIRLPKNGTEITSEGNLQRICIGGYVGRHSRGETNIFFLRTKERPDAPFYAIEMNNAKNIVQIHGYCNKWLGNDPDAIPTVIRWLRKNGITCRDEILTCKSTGYGSSREYVPMPVVD